MHLPHARLLGGASAPSHPLPEALRPPQRQLPLGLAPTGDFDHARERVMRDALDHWDALTPRNAIWFYEGRVWFPEAAQSDFASFLAPTSWATSQLCQRLGIPAPYFKKCPPRLQDAQFNHWIQHAFPSDGARADDGDPVPSGAEEPPLPDDDDDGPLVIRRPSAAGPLPEPSGDGLSERWLLRAKGGVLRGVLSSRYACLDNDCLLDGLARVLPPGFQVDWFSLTDESLHLRLVDTRTPCRALPGDDLMVGLHVANSEVGRRAVTVDALVYRLVCQNGLIRLVKGKSLMYRRHVHLSAPRFQEALEGAVLGALDEASRFLEQIQAAARVPVPDVSAVLALLGRQEALSKGFLEAAERSLRAEPSGQQETVWGLANGLTQAAQGLSPDDRYAAEALAGRLIEHGPPRLPASRPEHSTMRKEPENGDAGATANASDRPSRPVLGGP